MQSAITVCLVPAARSGPFVFHEGLKDACSKAAELGFDAVEVFPLSAASISQVELASQLNQNSLKLAAVGTGAGWLTQQLCLTATDPNQRAHAKEFIREIIDVAGRFNAPAIIGSMQGKIAPETNRDEALSWLAAAIEELAEHASRYHVPLLIEPLNRYETNVFNTLKGTAAWLETLKTTNARILADMFHMNIEEADMSQALCETAPWLGHIHFADSNRHAIGLGHTEAKSFVATLKKLNYAGYLSAEIFPLPNNLAAAQQTIHSFRQLVVSCKLLRSNVDE